MQAQIDPKLQLLHDDDYEAEGIMLRLPPARGKIVPNAPLADQTWFNVGGPAEALFRPVDADDLAHFLAHCPQDIPITVLGLASNVLIRDGGIPGVVVKLGPNFANIKISAATITAGAGSVDMNVARSALSSGITGFEFLSGIPGTIGGGLRLNAGAYGSEMKDVVTSVVALDRAGNRHIIYNDQMDFGYRRCGVPKDWIFVEATMDGEPGDTAEIRRTMDEIQKSRINSQPIRDKTCGSTFVNPEENGDGKKVWQLIDAAGCRGLKIGGAKVSEKHCNFIVNTGNAIAADIETLGEEVRRRVRDKTGIELRWEIQRLGVKKMESDDV